MDVEVLYCGEVRNLEDGHICESMLNSHNRH